MVRCDIGRTQQQTAVGINDLKETPAGVQIVIPLSCRNIDSGRAWLSGFSGDGKLNHRTADRDDKTWLDAEMLRSLDEELDDERVARELRDICW